MRERRRLARPEISEQDAALLHHRIGGLADVGTQAAPFRLGRRFQALAADVEQPAMERAAQPAMLEPPEREISAAVRTSTLEEAIAAAVIAEQHQAFAEQPHRLDRAVAGELICQRGRLPVVPHQRSGWRSATDTGDEVILLGAQHGHRSLLAAAHLYDCRRSPG